MPHLNLKNITWLSWEEKPGRDQSRGQDQLEAFGNRGPGENSDRPESCRRGCMWALGVRSCKGCGSAARSSAVFSRAPGREAKRKPRKAQQDQEPPGQRGTRTQSLRLRAGTKQPWLRSQLCRLLAICIWVFISSLPPFNSPRWIRRLPHTRAPR